MVLPSALFFCLLMVSCVADVVARMSPTGQIDNTDDVPTSWVSLKSISEGTVEISWELHGFPTNVSHALHIHEFGDISDASAGLSTGDHYNPTEAEHGCYPDPRHAGDLIAQLDTDSEGKSAGTLHRDLVDLSGDHSALGRSIVIHMDPDDCGPNNGNAGPRISQGVLGITAAATGTTTGPSLPEGTTLIAVIQGTEGYESIEGTVLLTVFHGDLFVSVDITGVEIQSSDRILAFHIHEYGDIASSDDGTSTGNHYDPLGETHGLPSEETQHRGDLGNVRADGAGIVNMQMKFSDHGVTLQDLLGLAVVMHHDEDQGAAQAESNGNAGARIAVGVIGVSNLAFPYDSSDQVVARMYPTVEMGDVYATTSISWVSLSAIGGGLVEIAWELYGFPLNSSHALHIHEYGDISDASGMATGGHYNPNGAEHGCYPDDRHAGDLIAEVHMDHQGKSFGTVQRDLVHLSGVDSALGRSIVIHEYADECGENNGNAGARISQGVLGTSQPKISDGENGANATVAGSDVLVAKLYGLEGHAGIEGNVWLTKHGQALYVAVQLSGVDTTNEDGYLGFHIHEFGDLRSLDGLSTGDHFNPFNQIHGLPSDLYHHEGDLGNVVANKNRGDVRMMFITIERFKVELSDLVGLSIILHRDQDQGVAASRTNGNAGPRIAAGVIGVSDQPFPVVLSLDLEWEYGLVFLGVCAVGMFFKKMKDNPDIKPVKGKDKRSQEQSKENHGGKMAKASINGGYQPPVNARALQNA